MVSGGVETILGVQLAPVFRPIVIFGLGGIFVEALEDVTFSAAPFDKVEARAMSEEITAFPILTGLRGQPPADLDALAAALSRLSLFAAANAAAIQSLDTNPILVRPEGALALDAVLIPPPLHDPRPPTAPPPPQPLPPAPANDLKPDADQLGRGTRSPPRSAVDEGYEWGEWGSVGRNRVDKGRWWAVDRRLPVHVGTIVAVTDSRIRLPFAGDRASIRHIGCRFLGGLAGSWRKAG